MKDLGTKQNKLAIRLRNNQREIDRLMDEYETLDAVVVSGSDIKDMEEWLVQPRKRRRASEVKCEPLDNTQTTDTSHHSQSSGGETFVSDAASDALAGEGEFSDDVTGDDEDSENEEHPMTIHNSFVLEISAKYDIYGNLWMVQTNCKSMTRIQN